MSTQECLQLCRCKVKQIRLAANTVTCAKRALTKHVNTKLQIASVSVIGAVNLQLISNITEIGKKVHTDLCTVFVAIAESKKSMQSAEKLNTKVAAIRTKSHKPQR